jgi:hypothetical protein
MAGILTKLPKPWRGSATLQEDFDADYVRETYPYVKPEHFDMFVEGLRRAGWTG